jgi:hypothetical protein
LEAVQMTISDQQVTSTSLGDINVTDNVYL